MKKLLFSMPEEIPLIASALPKEKGGIHCVRSSSVTGVNTAMGKIGKGQDSDKVQAGLE
jgi:hypothetical protein